MSDELYSVNKPDGPIKPIPKDAHARRVTLSEGSVEVKKKPIWRRIKEAVFAGTAKGVAQILWKDIALPTIKKLVDEGASNAVHIAIYGETKPRNNGQGFAANSSVYNGHASNYYNRPASYYNRVNRNNNPLENLRFYDQREALDIIYSAMDWIKEYQFLSVQRLNDEILPERYRFPTAYTDEAYGWSSLNPNCVIEVADGVYMIDLPPAHARG